MPDAIELENADVLIEWIRGDPETAWRFIMRCATFFFPESFSKVQNSVQESRTPYGPGSLLQPFPLPVVKPDALEFSTFILY